MVEKNMKGLCKGFKFYLHRTCNVVEKNMKSLCNRLNSAHVPTVDTCSYFIYCGHVWLKT